MQLGEPPSLLNSPPAVIAQAGIKSSNSDQQTWVHELFFSSGVQKLHFNFLLHVLIAAWKRTSVFPAAGRDPQHMASPSSSSGITPGTLSYPIFICCEGPALNCAWLLFISNTLKTVESIKQVLDGYDLYQSDILVYKLFYW